jgi:cytochrome c biogenesis factor
MDLGSRERIIFLSFTGLKDEGEPETVYLAVTLKPLMSLVWMGCWMLIGGGAMAIYRRTREVEVRAAERDT